jgi:hypothetical protein
MKLIPLTKGFFAKVDDDDYLKYGHLKWISQGLDPRPARRMSTDTGVKLVYLYRLIMNAPKGKDVDHINGNALDNRKSNLRIATHSDNLANSKLHKNNTSGYRGICWAEYTKRWRVKITKNYKIYEMGYFDTKKEAITAYNELAKKLHGEFAKLNFLK